MKDDRRLAAIIFADIAGYTAMMQSDELNAMRILDRYNSALTEYVDQYQGEIVKRYGDGTLILFASSINAVNCCVALQKAFREVPKVPLRIGVHMGEVTKKEGDYFGNDINIAARVESMGTIGAVLISKDVETKINNQPHLIAQSLGQFHFKNVIEPLEVFALSNDGLVVPNKKNITGKFKEKESFWSKYKYALLSVLFLIGIGSFYTYQQLNNGDSQIEDANILLGKKVAVLPFINQTGDSLLNNIGVMATDWLNQVLLSNQAGQVINVDDQKQGFIGTKDLSNFIETKNVDILIKGRYYSNQGDIYISTSVINTENMEVVFATEPIKGTKEQMVDMLNELQQKTMGYWFLRDEDWVASEPPNFDAYNTFLSHKESWLIDDKKSKTILNKAHEQDSTFYRPLISLAVLHYNNYQNEKADSILTYIASKNYPLSPFEKLRVQTIKATLDADWGEAARLSDEVFENYHQQFTDAIGYNLNINNPNRVVEIYKASPELFAPGDCYSCQQPFATLADSYIRLGLYDEVVDLINPIMDKVIDANIAVHHLRALVRLYQMEEVDKTIESYKKQALEWYGVYNTNLLYWAVCQELYLSDKQATLKKFAEEMLAFAEKHPDNFTYEQDLYTSYLFLNDLENAIKYAEIWNQKNGNYYYYDLVALKVKNGNKELGLSEIIKSKPDGLANDHKLWEYNQAKIYTSLGKDEQAINLLTESLSNGQYFTWYTFENDIFFKDLLDNETFNKLTTHK